MFFEIDIIKELGYDTNLVELYIILKLINIFLKLRLMELFMKFQIIW